MANPAAIGVIVGTVGAFVLGACVGSFLNVCIARMPFEKSILWPQGSRCMSCLRSIRARDNIPILSWFLLRGRCRFCKAPFSIRYALVELFTAVGYALLFQWFAAPYAQLDGGLMGVPWSAVGVFLHAATLFSLLVAASGCDLEHRLIPLGITLFGTVVGIGWSIAFPWPWPNDFAGMRESSWAWLVPPIPPGLMPWPAWGPLPFGFAPGSTALGIVNGIVGALFGTFALRTVKFLFEKGLRKEALGLGDADLMMMAGAFVGWQVIAVGFFLGAVAALVLAVPAALIKGDNQLPFGPGLSIGVFGAWLAWPDIGTRFRPFFFDEILLAILAAMMAVGMYVLSLFMRHRRG